uniref:Uncharacterized protein n=1 Tax=Bos indicus x Bos taurus TaxID=30522 RepID=A0A4W2EU52_BOBOX
PEALFCPYGLPLGSPRAGAALLTRPASFVPHGAGRGAPVVFALCAHPIPKRRGCFSHCGLFKPPAHSL